MEYFKDWIEIWRAKIKGDHVALTALTEAHARKVVDDGPRYNNVSYAAALKWTKEIIEPCTIVAAKQNLMRLERIVKLIESGHPLFDFSGNKSSYYTGKPCKRCGTTRRYISGGNCVNCSCKNAAERKIKKRAETC